MNNVVIMAFTSKGHAYAERLRVALSGAGWSAEARRVSNINDYVPTVFKKGFILVFVGAAGIAVRAVAGLLKSKADDPAVIVADELGRYVIPILSGHLGGANRFAEQLAGLVGAVPVLTTATDINNVFSIDTFAARNGYYIANPECIKRISAALLEGAEVGFCTRLEISGELPAGLVLSDGGELGVSISTRQNDRPFRETLALMPKYVHVGIGTRRNVPFDGLREFFLETLAAMNIPAACVGTISSIDLKRDEEAIVRLADAYGIDFITYAAESLAEHEAAFERSDFVKRTTGAGNICEISAWLSSGKGEIITKRVKNGMTLAIAAQIWRVRFEA